jgi:hypothetical protein
VAVPVPPELIAQNGQDGGGARTGIVLGHPGAPAHPPDELDEPHGMRLGPAPPPHRDLLSQFGEVGGEPPGLAVAQLIAEAFQHGPGDVGRFLTGEPGPVGYRAEDSSLAHGPGSLLRPPGPVSWPGSPGQRRG